MSIYKAYLTTGVLCPNCRQQMEWVSEASERPKFLPKIRCVDVECYLKDMIFEIPSVDLKKVN